MAYYAISDNTLIIAEKKKILTPYYDNVQKLPDDYLPEKYIVENNELILNPHYEEEQAQKEQERIQALYMTRSDFFDGTIKAFGLDSEDLYLVIENVLATLGISEIEKKVALNNYKNALNFYRKHTLFTLLSDHPIPLSPDTFILITKYQWDKFFDETNKRNPEAYKELLPPTPINPILDNEVLEDSEEDIDTEG